MWGFPIMFWLVALLIYSIAVRRRRRWARWSMLHSCRPAPYGYLPYAHPWQPSYDDEPRGRRRRARERDAGDDSYVETLESRIAELEQRLDFTERLLGERREASTKETPAQ